MSQNGPDTSPRGKYLAALTLAALGVVYGDIGTSPLYAIRECFRDPRTLPLTPDNVLGVLSLIFWALVIVLSIKYLAFVMRADNQGEGGILALMALVQSDPDHPARRRWLIVALGLFGAALLYGDGMITPAISVLSAVEGLEIATPVLQPYIIPITIGILVGLFALQRRGTGGVGALFGPVTLVWFLVIGVLGIIGIAHAPHVLLAIDPLEALRFFVRNGWAGFVILGSVFLAVTGAEALYADLGHFGLRPIRLAWFALVLPALLLNYFGQGAILLHDAAAVANPFYHLAPDWALYPLIGLATAATIIASQAVISGAFSLTRQAVQLGYSPRVSIEHTSSAEIGQIYIPGINWTLMIATVALVLGFRSSSNLAAAYGVAVTSTMVITTFLLYVVARELWHWGYLRAIALTGFFLIVDLAFFGANITKVPHGGWFPLVVAGGVFLLMETWKRGRAILADRLRERSVPLEVLLPDIKADPPIRVPGTAVYMTGNPSLVPPALIHNLAHNKVLHERVVFLTIETMDVPAVSPRERVVVEALDEGFQWVTARYGFMQDPSVPEIFERCRSHGLEVNLAATTFFLGRESLISTPRPGMARWREKLFAVMSRNAQRATTFFHIPSEQVFEVGVEVEI
ncbi:MAG TPA: potassium transporter Kup [Gemmatimonadales bacterium]|nr:potassium transporter Kup [Gemmatimonadales bacterium]